MLLAPEVAVPLSPSSYLLMLLFLLDQVEDSTRECAIQTSRWLHRDVWSLDGSEDVIDRTDASEFVVADLSTDDWDWSLFESKN